MKLTKNYWILIAVIAFVIATVVLSRLGIEIAPLLNLVLIVAVGYIIIDGISGFANRLVDALAKRQAVSNEGMNAKIEVMMQRMQIIENKVDEINKILEKVSE